MDLEIYVKIKSSRSSRHQASVPFELSASSLGCRHIIVPRKTHVKVHPNIVTRKTHLKIHVKIKSSRSSRRQASIPFELLASGLGCRHIIVPRKTHVKVHAKIVPRKMHL